MAPKRKLSETEWPLASPVCPGSHVRARWRARPLEPRRGCAFFPGSPQPLRVRSNRDRGTRNPERWHPAVSWGARGLRRRSGGTSCPSFCPSTRPQTSPHLPGSSEATLDLAFLSLKITVTYLAVPSSAVAACDLFGCDVGELQSQRRGPSSLSPRWNPAFSTDGEES